MLIIKLSGAAVFVAAAAMGVGILTGKILFYELAIAFSGAALLAVIVSAIRWRRRPSGYS